MTAFPVISCIHGPEQKSFSSTRGSQNEPWTSFYSTIICANKNIISGTLNDSSYCSMASTLYSLVRGGQDKKMLIDNSLMSEFGGGDSEAKKKKIGGNVLSKAVKVTTRGVITNNPWLDVNEISISESVAGEIQTTEVVTIFNIDSINELMKKGKIHKILRDNRLYSAISNEQKIVLGDTVYGDIIDGDGASFNRAPSLLPGYLCGFKIRISDNPEQSTIQMNIFACNMVNADFDGDTMFIVYPNGTSAKLELKYINSVENMIVNHQNSGLNAKITDECVVSLFKLSINENVPKSHYDFIRLNTPNAGQNDIEKGYKNNQIVTGNDIISCYLPDNLNYKDGTSWYDSDIDALTNNKMYKKHEFIVIENGYIKQGVIDNNINRILETILVLDSDLVLLIMKNLQMLSLNYIRLSTITIGYNETAQFYQNEIDEGIKGLSVENSIIDNDYINN